MSATDKTGDWASKKIEGVLKELGTDSEKGLTSGEAEARLKRYGENVLVEEERESFLDALKEEVRQPMILLLLSVGVLYSILGSVLDAVTIFTVIIVLVSVEVYSEYKAEQGVESLKKLASPSSIVLRDGKLNEVPSAQIVPGDILLLSGGERISADARVIKAYGLQVDESSLTGESLSVMKDAEAVVPANAQTTDLTNMVLAGTLITQGEGLSVVTSTGKNTELGKISELTKEAKEPDTPLQVAMEQASKTLVLIALFFSILIPVLSYVRASMGGYLRVQGLPTLILTGLSLAFAVIPEELPIIITMVLAVGTHALSKQHVLVKRLRASETLGSVTVIATDKTGTLTENSMKLGHLYVDHELVEPSGSPDEKGLLKIGILATHAQTTLEYEKLQSSNPMGAAILRSTEATGLGVKEPSDFILADEFSFDNKTKMASYVYQHGDKKTIYSSGAPESIIEKSSKILVRGKEVKLNGSERKKMTEVADEVASSGERIIALAYRTLGANEKREAFVKDLVFAGMASFLDPPRPDVQGVVSMCEEAGIRIIMLTGDHPETAKAIATKVGIGKDGNLLTGEQISVLNDEQLKEALKTTSIFARITPEHKLRIVSLLEDMGQVVAVTGDGVNDAPALKKAAIGIAMGQKGTDAAKEAADIILTDDNFASIGNAVREGRKIFDNLKKGVTYYLSVKVALVLIFLLPILLGIPLPFAPIQIIVLEMFMDLAASSGFVAEGMEPDIMKRPPRDPKEKLLNKRTLTRIFVGAGCLFVAVSLCYVLTYYRTGDLIYAQTAAFATWILSHIFLAFNTRSETEPFVKIGIFSNKVMDVWGLAAIVLLVSATVIPILQTLIRTTSLGWSDWLLVLGASFVATFWIEAAKLIRKHP
ncbi:MAG TPA: cation-transporting P-type ATPase [candidate division Zixibacteria bacterium]|nr:cation-transporting P-type ATPase [candidate division Zixibacteria bacterium]